MDKSNIVLPDECRPLTEKCFYVKKKTVLPKQVEGEWVWLKDYYVEYKTFTGHLSYTQSQPVKNLLQICNSKQ
jgi:hypothetical protein